MNRSRLFILFVLLTLFIIPACAWLAPLGPNASPNPELRQAQTIVAGTLTAYPTPSPGPSLTATLQQTPTPAAQTPQTPQGFIYLYFDQINARNYSLTWTLLTDRFKGNLDGSDFYGYQDYVTFWDSVSHVTVVDVSYSCQEQVCAVAVTLQLAYTSGQLDTSTYPYTLTYDLSRNTWLFDFIPAPTATPSLTQTVPHKPTKTPPRTPTKTPTRTPRTKTPTATRTNTPTRTPKTKTPTATRTSTPTRRPNIITPAFSQTYVITYSPIRTTPGTPSPTKTIPFVPYMPRR